MANNPYVNKVELADGTTLMDISDTTAGAEDVRSGEVFYTASGTRSVGTMSGGIQYIVPTEAVMLAIPVSAFSGNLIIEKVYFPSCTTIGSSAFNNCRSLTEASFPACITINSSAFYNCNSLTEASFPVCTNISNNAFRFATGSLYLGAYSKSSIYAIFGKLNASSASASGYASYIQISGIEIPAMTSLVSYAFYSASNLQTVKAVNCTDIGSNAFQNCSSLTTISFPVCTNIGDYAFYSCYSLTEASFPACITIGSFAFEYCTSLTEASFPVCTSIGSYAFHYITGSLYLGAYSSLSIYTIFGKLNASSASASALASYIKISGIEIPAMTSLVSYAFYFASNLQTVKAINCTNISGSAFYSCYSLATISFPVCTTIGNGAFGHCRSLTTISFTVCTSIGSYAFAYCSSLTEAYFPSCTTIGYSAFNSCYSLATISFPVCTSIRSAAFYACSSLMSAYFLNSSVCTLGTYAFGSTPMSLSTYTGTFGSIYVPSSLVESYKTATNWTVYSDRITAYTE